MTVASAGLGRIATLVGADTVYLSVGTGTNTPGVGNTQLQTETNREISTQQIVTGGKIEWRAFFANADLPTTVEEVGLHLNASGSANSGSLLERTLSTLAKGSKDLQLSFAITFQEV